MKLITRDTDYAIRALCAIAQAKGKITTVSELVEAIHIPRPFLRKLLQRLTQSGILTSYKGKNGGFLLIVKPEKIHIIDVIKIYQGPLSLSECFFKKRVCPQKKSCPLRKKIDSLEKYVIEELRNISLRSLLDQT